MSDEPRSGILRRRDVVPGTTERDLHRVMLDLEQIERFEASVSTPSTLARWASESDGSGGATDDEVAILSAAVLSGDDSPRARRLRADLWDHLLASATPEARVESDPDWRAALLHQHRLRALQSQRATALPAAVLRWLARHAVPSDSLDDVADRAGAEFASVTLREAWTAATVREETSRLAAGVEARGRTKGRPKVDRAVPVALPAVQRRAFGRELIEWAIATWQRRPYPVPTWVPAAHRATG